MTKLQKPKIYYHEKKIEGTDIVRKFFSIIAVDDNGNEYHLFLDDFDTSMAKERYRYLKKC